MGQFIGDFRILGPDPFSDPKKEFSFLDNAISKGWPFGFDQLFIANSCVHLSFLWPWFRAVWNNAALSPSVGGFGHFRRSNCFFQLLVEMVSNGPDRVALALGYLWEEVIVDKAVNKMGGIRR